MVEATVSPGATGGQRALCPARTPGSLPRRTRAGRDFHRPPGAFAPGERHASELQDSALYYGEATKDYRFTARRKGARAVTGKLHMDSAMRTLDSSYDLQLVTWIGQGDATCKAGPARRR